MIKIFSIFLASLLLGQSLNIHFNDFIKIGELVEHAEFHAEKYGDNFFEFLSKHYGDLKQSHQQDHEKEGHHHLPFDHHDCSASASIVLVIKPELYIADKEDSFVSEDSHFSYQDLFSSFEKQKVFQPPKQA